MKFGMMFLSSKGVNINKIGDSWDIGEKVSGHIY